MEHSKCRVTANDEKKLVFYQQSVQRSILDDMPDNKAQRTRRHSTTGMNDFDEIGFQRSAANQKAIDVGFLAEIMRVISRYRTCKNAALETSI